MNSGRVGLLSEFRRFNVAMTRAKALTVIIGNPWVLAQYDFWRAQLQFCARNGGCRGVSQQLVIFGMTHAPLPPNPRSRK